MPDTITQFTLGDKNFELNATNFKKWLHNLKLFLIPVAILYIVTVIGLITTNDNLVKREFFVPSPTMQGSIVLYLLNGLLDFLRKLTVE